MEKAFFFVNEGLSLFGYLHTPEVKNYHARSGIVICHPFGDEHIGTYRIVRDLALELCRKGINVLRFDYRGYGDSEGEFEEATPETQVSDIKKATQILQTMTGVKEIGLLGVRLGGTLAMLAAQSEPVIKYVVVWVPILNPKIYFQGILRRQIYSAMLNMEEKKSLKDLYSELKLGGKVDIGGYYLSDKAYNAFCEIDFSELLKQARQPVHIGLLERETTNTDKIVLGKVRDTIESPLDVTMVPDEPFWNFIMQKDISPPVRLMEETVKWLYNAEYLSGIACGSID